MNSQFTDVETVLKTSTLENLRLAADKRELRHNFWVENFARGRLTGVFFILLLVSFVIYFIF
jgi:hypothetical protein